jgi:hypothetical protein
VTPPQGSTPLRRWAKRVFRALLGGTALIALLLGWLVAAGLTRNYLRAETRGTMPIERLARQGSELERAVTLAMADSLKTQRFPPSWKWYAARTISAGGDPISFRIYRAQDARLLAKLLRPEPHIGGGGWYIVSERRFVALGIGIR